MFFLSSKWSLSLAYICPYCLPIRMWLPSSCKDLLASIAQACHVAWQECCMDCPWVCVLCFLKSLCLFKDLLSLSVMKWPCLVHIVYLVYIIYMLYISAGCRIGVFITLADGKGSRSAAWSIASVAVKSASVESFVFFCQSAGLHVLGQCIVCLVVFICLVKSASVHICFLLLSSGLSLYIHIYIYIYRV